MTLPLSISTVLEVSTMADELHFNLKTTTAEPGDGRIFFRSVDRSAVYRLSFEVSRYLQQEDQRGRPGEVLPRLKRLGQELFDLLIPSPLQGEIHLLKSPYLLLRLEESLVSIPWELIHDGAEFLCCKFGLGREVISWKHHDIVTRHRPAQRLSFLILTDPTNDLPASRLEGEALFNQLSMDPRFSVEWLNGPISSKTASEFMLQSDAVHFSGHGETGKKAPASWAWKFSDDGLQVPEFTKWFKSGSDFPFFVFSNACHVHQPFLSDPGTARVWESEVTHLSLPRAFKRMGCEHLVDTIGKVSDVEGRQFGNTFYQFILQGYTIGMSLQLARLELRSTNHQDDLTWAQYQLYGEPWLGLFGESLVAPEMSVLVLAETMRNGQLCDEPARTGSVREKILELVAAFPGAELVDQKEPYFLVVLRRPSEAVRFAVLLHSFCAQVGDVSCRVSAHSGELLIRREEGSGACVTVEGLPLEVGRRLLEMSQLHQTLTTRPVFDSARAVLRNIDIAAEKEVTWLDHGAYRLHGFEEPVGVCEIGLSGWAPLTAPANSEIAVRYVTTDQETVLGWRPALDQVIPTSPDWVLTEKLGEGGFGEVWRARGKDGVETRVFKFCFRADRVRSLKREVTLFRMLREAVGDHPLIVHIFGVQLESPPYYIEMEDVQGNDLVHWCQRHGGVDKIPLEVRLDIVAQTAEALQAAHDAGIIHRDVKPSNILVVGKPHAPSTIAIKLGDFGIGQTVTKNSISTISYGGFTETFTPTEIASQSGTRLYMAPELMSGRSASIRSDIYSLGVVLYQLLIGDLYRIPATDWQKDVADPLLQADVGKCLAGSPTTRFIGAAELAMSLRTLDVRRTQLEYQIRQEKRAHFRRRTLLAGAAVLGMLLVFVGALAYGLIEANRSRRVAETEKERAQAEEYFSKVALAQRAIEGNQPESANRLLLDCPLNLRGWEWGRLLLLCNKDMMAYRGLAGYGKCLALSPDGKWIAAGADDGQVKIWDLVTGAEAALLDSLSTRVESLAFTPDSRLLAAQSGNLVQIYDSSTGTRIRELRLPHKSVAGVAFNPVSGQMAYDQDNTRNLVLFDLKSDQVISEFEGHYQWITDFAFSQDGRKVITTSYDNTVRLWDVESGGEIALHKTPYAPKSVAFGRNGDIALVAIEKTGAVILNVENGLSQGWDSKVPEGAASVDISPDEEFLLVVQLNNVTKIWDWKRPAPPVSLEHEYGPALFDMTGDSIVTVEPGGPVKRWCFQLGDGGTPIYGHNLGYLCHAIAFSPNGTRVATGSDDQTASIWDVESGEEIAMLQHYREVSSLVFSPDGSNLITGCRDGTIWVWDSGGEHRTRRIKAHADEISSMAVTHDSALLLTGSYDGTIGVWDYKTGTEMTELLPECGKVQSISLSPDETRILAAGGSGNVVIMSLDSGQITAVLKGHTSIVRDCEWAPDGSWIVTAGEDGTCRKWDPMTGMQTAIYRGTSGNLQALEVTSDGRRVLTSGKILDSSTFREIIGIKDIWAPIELSADGLMLGTNVFETPAIIRSFPWNYESFQALSAGDLEGKIEQFKRDFWKRRKENKCRWGYDDRFRSLPNTITGQWDFDEGDLRATKGRDMLYYDYEELGAIESNTRFGTTRSFGIPDIAGKEANIMFFPPCGTNEGYRMFHGALVSESGKRINQYTIILDLLYPSTSSGTWRSILNTDGNNQNRADLYISDRDGLGVDDDFAGMISPDQWHRIACVFDLSATPPILGRYVDGVPIGTQMLSAGENGRWSVPPADRGRWILLFADPEGRTNSGYVNSIQFRNYAMTADEIAVLHGPSAEGIPVMSPAFDANGFSGK